MSSVTVLSFDRCLPASRSFQLLTVAESLSRLSGDAWRELRSAPIVLLGGDGSGEPDRIARTTCTVRVRASSMPGYRSTLPDDDRGVLLLAPYL